MNKIFMMLFLSIMSLIAADKNILYTQLTDGRFNEFSGQYNRKFLAIWTADSGVRMVPDEIIETIRYRTGKKQIPLDSATVADIKRLGYDSVFAVIPQLEEFSVITKRGTGFPGVVAGKGEGKLAVRFRFMDLSSGKTLYTGVALSDTTISLGTTMLRPLRKSVNISAIERDQIVTTLIDQNVREAYRILQVYKGDQRRDTVETDTTETE